MPIKYECTECGNSLPEDLIDYLEEGNQVFCERCGAPFPIKKVKIDSKNEFKKRDLISSENKIKAKKAFIGIISMNFLLVIFFFLFTPLGFIKIFQLNFIGVIIFIFILLFGILEIIRGFKLFRNKAYGSQILMVNTIGQVLLRKVLYPPSTEENIHSNENEIKALKILIPIMYMNFILANFYYSTTFHLMSFVYDISLFLFIYTIVEIFHLSIGFIILLKVKKLGYRFLKVSSLVQLIFYNSIMVLLYIFNRNLNFILILLLDVSIIYLTIKIIKNKDVLMQYFRSKNRICHNCGSKMIDSGKNCPKCLEVLSKGDIDLEVVPVKKIEQPVSSFKEKPEPKVIIGKGSEPEENPEGSEYSKDLSFLKDEKDKKLLEQYLLERFIVVSEQLRRFIDKLNLSREEKIDLLKDFSFLTSKEQQNLLELLVHLCND